MHAVDLSSMVVQERYDLKDQGQSQVTHTNTNANSKVLHYLSERYYDYQVTKPILTLTSH